MLETRIPHRELLLHVRGLLLPRWRALHEADVAWRRTKAVPAIPSHAMCRHSVAFLRRMMIQADRMNGLDRRSRRSLSSEWAVVRGRLDTKRLDVVPEYARRDPTHYVMMDRAGRAIDVTADQFGLDPLAIHHASTFFAEAPTVADPGLAGAARTWATDPACASAVELLGRL